MKTNQVISKLKRESLGFFPTPLHELPALSKVLNGPKIFIKRDDNTGLAFGGNKTRKLEFILGDAVAKGADTIITAGAIQSNHCRQTAAAAASLQLDCHLVLGGEAPNTPRGNLLLDNLLGNHIHWAGENRKGEDIPELVERLKKEGRKPYIVPYGGSNTLGAIGFTVALLELDAQLQSSKAPITHIVFASSSGGTHAGLMLGKEILGASYELIGINIDKDESGNLPFEDALINLANDTADFIGIDHTFTKKELNLNADYIGEGYAVIGDLEKEAISLTAQTEGILLDPVYTGRAMGGLFDLIRTEKLSKTDNVLFWHTGGAPALFAYSEHLF